MEPAEGALDEVAEEDGDNWVVELLVDEVDEADDEDQHVVVELHVQASLEAGEVRVTVSHQSERCLGLIFKHEGGRTHMP